MTVFCLFENAKKKKMQNKTKKKKKKKKIVKKVALCWLTHDMKISDIFLISHESNREISLKQNVLFFFVQRQY